nr:MAG TPA: hypothetical protein [Caudoviricetes sp.]
MKTLFGFLIMLLSGGLLYSLAYTAIFFIQKGEASENFIWFFDYVVIRRIVILIGVYCYGILLWV